MDIYERLKKLCESQNTTITQVAKDLKLSTSMPTAWKNGICPSGETVVKLAKYFDCTTDYILRGNKPTDEEVAQGVANFEMTPDKEELLMLYEEIGSKLGKEAQSSFLSYARFLVDGKK